VLRFQSLEVLLQWFVSHLLVFFFLFFFFFCNHAFIVIMRSHPLVGFFFLFFSFFFLIMCLLFLRYKKPHAALAMEKTKPINQKQITKESHGTS